MNMNILKGFEGSVDKISDNSIGRTRDQWEFEAKMRLELCNFGSRKPMK